MTEEAKGFGELQQGPDTTPSPEELRQFDSMLDEFLLSLRNEVIDEGDGWSTVQCQAEVADGNHVVYVFARFIRHKDFGTVSREFIHIARGTESVGPGLGSDFALTIRNASEGPLTIDTETGEVISGVREVIKFEDNAAIKARKQQLLDDLMFDGSVSTGVVIPNLKVTSSGEIYKDGLSTLDHKQLGGLCVKTTVFHDNEDDRRVFERQCAAYAQARKDVGTELTTERMARVIEVLNRIQ